MIALPEYDKNTHQWKVVWSKATFWFSSFDSAFSFYNDNKGDGE